MLILLLIANAGCLSAAILLLRLLWRPAARRAAVENFAAVLRAIRAGTQPASAASHPVWIPWHDKETRPC